MNTKNSLDSLFKPASVAVIGASTSPAKLGYQILENIVKGGFRGEVYPINPKADAILDMKCHGNVKDVPGHVDLAVVIIPARFVPQAIEDCGAKGVRGAVVITGGFSEAGEEGEALERQLADAARAHGVRVVGPNCQGINNPWHPLCASWPLLTARGKVAAISMSGTVGAAMMDWFAKDGLGVSAFVSMGNRADVDEADLIDWFNEDEATKVIAAYIEGVKSPERFLAALEKVDKPVVVLKSGKTPHGRVAAESHTKSLAGTDGVFEAVFNRYGIYRAETFEEFYDLSKGLAYLYPAKGDDILFITTSGGAAILATDIAEIEGLSVPPLPVELADKFEEIVPAHAIKANPLDLTGDATAEMFGQAIEAARPYYSTLGVIFGDPVERASEVVTPGANELIIFMGGAEVEDEEVKKMHEKEVPAFPTPERGIKTLAKMLADRVDLTPKEVTTLDAARETRPLPPGEVLALLEENSIPHVFSRVAASEQEALEAARDAGYPVALKVVSPDIIHKSDAEGVVLGIEDEDRLKAELGSMAENFEGAGFLVSKMADPGVECIVGMVRDPQFGPTVMFGLGGLFVELYRDVSFSLAPLTREEALAMIRSIKGYPVLAGVRGRAGVDEEALAGVIVQVGLMASGRDDILEVDLNPVIAYPDGTLAVDARILVKA